MDPEKCDKRQREVKKGRDGLEIEQFRCLDGRHTDNYLKVVETHTCELCPLLAAKIKAQGCQKHWSQDLLSVQTVARDTPNPLADYKDLHYEQACVFRWDGRCKITGHEVNPEICKACDQETADHMATLPEMAVGFAAEVKVWIREGRPTRTDEEVAERLEICKGCDLYDKQKEACKKCGCKMNNNSWPLRNGIRMATKVCPMGLWK